MRTAAMTQIAWHLRPYTAILSARFRLLLQYRAAAVAGFATQLFWGMMRVMIFTAFFDSTTLVMPMTRHETVMYIWLGQALLLLVPWNMDRDLQEMVRSGHVVYELVRPMDLLWTWFARALAMRSAPVILRSIPMFIVAGLFLDLDPPPSLAAGIAFLFTVCGAMLVSSAITTLMNISLFWTISGQGLVSLMPSVVMMMSGLIIPLPFFPDWLQPVLNFLPFRGIIDVPFRIYMGHISPGHAPVLILHQLAWTAALLLVNKWLIHRARQRILIQGG